jgi:hypothetical protein
MMFSKAFLISAVTAFAIAAPTAAAAKYQRYSGSFCTLSNVGNATSYRVPALNDSNDLSSNQYHGVTDLDGSQVTTLMCPIVDTDYLSHDLIKTLNVHGSGTSSNFAAKACWTTWNGSSGSCTASQGASGSGTNDSISFTNASGVFNGSGSSDFVYLYVQLNGAGAGGFSLRGYFAQDS